MDLGLAGKRCLVVGGSAGIGYETARALVAEGASVTIAARNAADLESAAGRIGAESDTDLEWFSVDATADDADSVLTENLAHPLDILIVTMGGSIRGEFDTHPDDNWRSNYDMNVLGPVRVVRTLLPRLREGDDPAIVILGAAASKMPYRNQVVSNVHKAGLLALVKTLALELAPTIRVNLVCPGPDPDSSVARPGRPDGRRLGNDTRGGSGRVLRGDPSRAHGPTGRDRVRGRVRRQPESGIHDRPERHRRRRDRSWSSLVPNPSSEECQCRR